MDLTFCEIDESHIKDMLGIYNYYVLNSTATFHINVLNIEEMKKIVMFSKPCHKTFVIMEGDRMCGYVLIGPHKEREAYSRTGEVTVYLAPGHTGRGIGRAALEFIERFAVNNCFHVLVATICEENVQSLALFSSNGYTKCAHYKEVGRKFDRWLDLVAYQKILE